MTFLALQFYTLLSFYQYKIINQATFYTRNHEENFRRDMFPTVEEKVHVYIKFHTGQNRRRCVQREWSSLFIFSATPPPTICATAAPAGASTPVVSPPPPPSSAPPHCVFLAQRSAVLLSSPGSRSSHSHLRLIGSFWSTKNSDLRPRGAANLAGAARAAQLQGKREVVHHAACISFRSRR